MTGSAVLLVLHLAAPQLDPQTGFHLSPLRDFVTMSLAADRVTYYRGERVRLSITLRNTSAEVATGYFALDPGLHSARVLYRAGSTEYRRLECFLSPPGYYYREPRSLAPGEELSKEVDVSVATLEPLAFLLDARGPYEFKVVYDEGPVGPNGKLESNVVSVSVVAAPASEREAQAAYTASLAYLAQVPSGARAFVTPERMGEAVAFLDQFRQSRYAGPVRDGLLKWLDYRTATQRASAEEAALFERLLKDTDTTRPELYVEVSPTTLWPPNHTLIPVQTSVSASDDEDPNPAVTLVSVTCDDSCDGARDIAGAEIGTDDREFELRAERTGTGQGRTYTITYSATDASGNRGGAEAKVVVPVGEGKGQGK